MYQQLAGRLSDGQVAGLVACSRRVDLAPGPGGSRITPVPLTHLPLLTSQWDRAMFVALYPSSQLVGHTDHFEHRARVHIPVVLNEGCWVFSDGTWQQLDVGVPYLMDPTKVHGAVNWGSSVRVHLILDAHGEIPSDIS